MARPTVSQAHQNLPSYGSDIRYIHYHRRNPSPTASQGVLLSTQWLRTAERRGSGVQKLRFPWPAT